jgi:hypothetical protein
MVFGSIALAAASSWALVMLLSAALARAGTASVARRSPARRLFMDGPSFGQGRYRAMIIAISPSWGNPLQSSGFSG